MGERFILRHRRKAAMIRVVATLLATCVALSANAQSTNFCTPAGGKTQLGFNVKPSLVAHSEAIMKTTFKDAQISGGEPAERLFSFKRTIGSILKSVNKPDDQAARVAFVQTMLDTFSPADDVALNPF